MRSGYKFDDTQRALMNMLEDIEVGASKAEQAKRSSSRSIRSSRPSPTRSPTTCGHLCVPSAGSPRRLLKTARHGLTTRASGILDSSRTMPTRWVSLIDDLLTFSRLGRQQMARQRSIWRPWPRSVFDELAAQTPGRKIEFSDCTPLRSSGRAA